jgi:serine phosphatase RsbU (regulator of sigma subunit)
MSDFIPVNTRAGAARLADRTSSPSPIPASERFAGLEPDYLVPVFTRDPQLNNFTPASRQSSQQSHSSAVRAMPGSLTSQVSESWWPANNLRIAVDSDRKRAHEMAIASEVQRKLLPQHMPPLETLDYAGSCEPAWSVGGDYYDFLDMGKGRVGFVLADVSGKGVSAALLMANLQASVRSQFVIAHKNLEKFFRTVNKLFHESVTPGFFATMFFADYVDATRRLRYVNCGHCPAFLVRANGICEKLGSTATVLGMFESWNCAVGETTMSSGDILVVYSDGVTEARSESDELFGEERLLAAVEANANLPAAGLLKAIAAAAHNFSGEEQEDDLTLLVARAC